MINWGLIFGKFISMVMSWLDASNLRTRVFELTEQNEILRTALEDVDRMTEKPLIKQHIKRTLELLD